MTLAYVPYSMSPANRDAMLTAFPSKLVTSVSAALPVLFHGPSEALPALFLQRYPVGVVCASHRRQAILDSLVFLLTDPQFRAGYAAARERAYREELSIDVMVSRLATLLGYPDSTARLPGRRRQHDDRANGGA